VKAGYKYLNEGIKFSAVMSALDEMAQGSNTRADMARAVLAAINVTSEKQP
jgi:hypothetical protein